MRYMEVEVGVGIRLNPGLAARCYKITGLG